VPDEKTGMTLFTTNNEYCDLSETVPMLRQTWYLFDQQKDCSPFIGLQIFQLEQMFSADSCILGGKTKFVSCAAGSCDNSSLPDYRSDSETIANVTDGGNVPGLMISVTDVLGFAGGLIGAVCTVPQLILMFRTRSAKEISILFAILYFVGLVLQASYCTLIAAWAGVIPIWFESLLALILLAGKFTWMVSRPKMMKASQSRKHRKGVRDQNLFLGNTHCSSSTKNVHHV
jgi:uncharacterized protein with PQ loop repeat